MQYLEGAMGSHYYRVLTIDNWQKVKEPEKAEIQEILASYNFCEADSDCVSFYGECPFGCFQAVNVKFLDISQQVMKNYLERKTAEGEPQCNYNCPKL